jgi:hypothetical protein
MTFFGNFPTLGWLAEPKSCVAVAPVSGLKPDTDAELEGFRKTAPRCRAAPSRTYLVGTDPAFKALVVTFFQRCQRLGLPKVPAAADEGLI